MNKRLITEIREAINMLVKPTDIKIVREKLEAKLGKEKLEQGIKENYERVYKKKNVSYEEAEEKILRWYYKVIYS